jgi:serine/threonine-protein kinase
MEWVDGETLNTIINSRENEPLDPRVAAHIVAQAAAGLHAAHELKDENGLPMQLVHRDVSPQNVLISRAGHVKVTDFGVAKALGDSREETAVGRVKGKLSYMSPEQAESKPVDRRSDVFALGVVLYLATVGAHPFRRANENRDDQYMRLLIGDFQRPSSVIPGYPSELEAIVLRAMSREPAERFATAEEMRLRLQEWLLRSGPLLTEQHIARAMTERVGKAIEDRAERIQRCIRASRRTDKLDVIATGSELTFLPTTSGMGGSMLTRTGIRTLGMPRVLAAAAVLLLLGLVGTMSLTNSADTPDSKKAAAAAAASPAPPAPLPAPPVASDLEKPASATPEPSPAAKAPAAAERRAPPSLAEAMARALAEKKEKARRDASGSSANDAASPDRGTRASSSSAARSGSRRGSVSSKIGPLENDL